MSTNGSGPELEAAGSGLVTFCVYDTVVLDSSEYMSMLLEFSLECITPWRGSRLEKFSLHERVCVLVTSGSKMSPFV